LAAASSVVDLIAVGTHKTGFIHGNIFGSRTLQLAAAARCPVAVIPEGGDHAHSRGVVVGADDSYAGRAAVRFAAAEADLRGVGLTLIRAWDQPPWLGSPTDRLIDEQRLRHEAAAILEGLSAVARSGHRSVEIHLRSVRRRAASVLAEASASALLLVLGGSRTSEAGATLLGAVSHDVLINIGGPTIIVHGHEVPPATGRRTHAASDLVDVV
jgi:nucleotide-binding universal stress UspA family protein